MAKITLQRLRRCWLWGVAFHLYVDCVANVLVFLVSVDLLGRAQEVRVRPASFCLALRGGKAWVYKELQACLCIPTWSSLYSSYSSLSSLCSSGAREKAN